MGRPARHPAAAVRQFQLHVFELAYLLSLMRVESVAALPDAVLFPPDPDLRRKALAQGQKRLIDAGLLGENETGEGEYDSTLLALAAAIADPRCTVLTRLQTPDGKRVHSTTYLNRVHAVEVTQTGKQEFRVAALDGVADAVQRCRKAMGVPPLAAYEGATAEAPIHEFQAARAALAEGDTCTPVATFTQAGLPRDAAESFAAALATPETKGLVSVLKHAGGQVVGVRVLGLQRFEGASWLTMTRENGTAKVIVQAIDTDGFAGRLGQRIAECL
ncbi:MAG: hypothetical protein AAGJ46_08825 [Planctomycetota bacterium]